MNSNKRIVAFYKFISSGYPHTYLAIYIIMMFLFALIYSEMHDNFFAPYTKNEIYSLGEKEELFEIIKPAIIDKFNEARKRTISLYTEILDGAYIDGNSTDDGVTYRTRLHFMYKTRAIPGINQAIIDINWQEPHSRIATNARSQNTESVPGRILTIEHSNLEERQDIHAKAYIDDILSYIKIISLNKDSNERIEYISSGLSGDPTKLNNSIMRMIYFSTTAITTTGFGDIVPITNLARTLVALESLLGIILIGLTLNSIAQFTFHTKGTSMEEKAKSESNRM